MTLLFNNASTIISSYMLILLSLIFTITSIIKFPFELYLNNKIFIVHYFIMKYVINFIQLVSPQLVDWFSQTKLYWKVPNEGYLHIYGIVIC